MNLKHPPKVFIGASAIGYYGDRGSEMLTENSSKGEGFLSDVCQEWEEETRSLAQLGIRSVSLRTGVVLSPIGGALKHMLPAFKWGVGGKMGSGEQWMSWVAIGDLVRIIDFALNEQSFSGPLNVVSPHPVTNQEFSCTLGRVLKRPTLLAMPAFMVKLVFGEVGTALLLSSQRVRPSKLEEIGFKFAYPNLEDAIRHLLASSTPLS
jgi:uncharacterized protein (TIGR01777 family)